MNKSSKKIVKQYYNNKVNNQLSEFSKFILSTELVKNQKTRTNTILNSKGGTLEGIAKKLNIETFEAEVLLEGLAQIKRIRKFIEGGVNAYKVLDNTPPNFT